MDWYWNFFGIFFGGIICLVIGGFVVFMAPKLLEGFKETLGDKKLEKVVRVLICVLVLYFLFG